MVCVPVIEFTGLEVDTDCFVLTSFSRGTRSGNESPIQPSRLTELKFDFRGKTGRSKSIDLGGTLISPLSSLNSRRMFSRDEELVEGQLYRPVL